MLDVLNRFNEVIWGDAMIFMSIGIGLLFTVGTGFVQVRLFGSMINQLRKGGDSARGISSFQSFAMALGGRVGVGNIAGVATAIYFGGPGAVFWMWVMGFVGAGTAFAESILSQAFKEEVGGEYRGGPAQSIALGSGHKWLGALFAATSFIACCITGPSLQTFNIADSMKIAFGVPPIAVGIAVAALFCIIVFGGVKRIGKFAEVVVPFMAIGYVIITVIVLAGNYAELPGMFALIFRSAFNMEATFGAIFGGTVMWGVRRAVYSSEAGMGTGAIAAAAAEVSHPAKQGLAQAFSVYIDTLVVCTCTALMILSTGAYNVTGADGETMIVHNLPGIGEGAGYTQAAIDSLVPGFGGPFVAIAIFFFAFTTILSFGFYTDSAVSFFFGENKHLKKIQLAAKILSVGMILFGSLKEADIVWGLEDMGVGMMVWTNLIGLILTHRFVFKLLKDYEKQRKDGLNPVFRPDNLGIKNAGLWNKINAL
ncbi:MAG: alanine:cation symporter family protein [Synergistaceae bacterium]|jgi:AGCS family alanine or glycine:cation symporter|nr:alanine:cation symporter family protein [Synergistaceae bacterium]